MKLPSSTQYFIINTDLYEVIVGYHRIDRHTALVVVPFPSIRFKINGENGGDVRHCSHWLRFHT